MKLTYDEKGKFFTEYVPKDALPVIIQALHFIVKGDVHLPPEVRLIDELNSSGKFIAVTNAIVYAQSGEELYRANFFPINLQHVVFMIPLEEMTTPPEFLGGS